MADAAPKANIKVSTKVETDVSTNTTLVEDRTEQPARHMVKKYKSEVLKLGNGTTLTNYTDEVE
jgi:hypothetical protein